MTSELPNLAEKFPIDVNDVLDDLITEGEQLDPFLLDRFEEAGLLEALKDKVGADMKEYLRHSGRFANLYKEASHSLWPYCRNTGIRSKY
jgi:hypothetical protein